MWNRKRFRQNVKAEEFWKFATISYSDDSNVGNDTDKNVTFFYVVEEKRVDQSTTLNDDLRRNSRTKTVSFTVGSKLSIIYER